MHLTRWCDHRKCSKKYPLKKPRGVYVNHAAPLRHRHGAIVAVAFTDDLAVDKHRDQGTLWEPPHVGLREGTNDVQMKLINWNKYKTFRVSPSGIYSRKGFLIPPFLQDSRSRELHNWIGNPKITNLNNKQSPKIWIYSDQRAEIASK